MTSLLPAYLRIEFHDRFIPTIVTLVDFVHGKVYVPLFIYMRLGNSRIIEQ